MRNQSCELFTSQCRFTAVLLPCTQFKRNLCQLILSYIYFFLFLLSIDPILSFSHCIILLFFIFYFPKVLSKLNQFRIHSFQFINEVLILIKACAILKSSRHLHNYNNKTILISQTLISQTQPLASILSLASYSRQLASGNIYH